MKPLGMLLAVAVLTGCGSGVTRDVLPVSPTTREIQAARKTDASLFSIFPGFRGTIRCRIPNGDGLVSQPLRGTCATRIRRPAAPRDEVDVVFREEWSGHVSTWTIIERLPGPTVQATRLSGETAPQMRYTATDGAAPKHLLAGEVQIAAYPHGEVYICGIQSSDLMFNQPPPDCRGALRAAGVDVAALTSHAKGNPERWGTLYLVGTYRAGTFHVTAQRKWAPPGRGPGPFFEMPPCAAPAEGWSLVAPTYTQKSKVRVYEHRHPRDITSVVYFHHSTIPVISAFHPARVRALLERYWPRQLCVVRARYPLRAVSRARRRLLTLMAERSRAAEYGWINGAGGLSESDQGQPTAPVDVLVETPPLRAFVRSEPPGLVVVDAALAPLQ